MVSDDGREINLTNNNALFYLEVKYQNVVNPSTCHETKQTIKDDINLSHKRLRHLNTTNLKRSVGGEGDTIGTCDTYAMGKQDSRQAPKKIESKAKKTLELVYCDILAHFEVYLVEVDQNMRSPSYRS